MPDDQDDQQTTDDQSESQSTQSDEQASQNPATDESTQQTTDDQSVSQSTPSDEQTSQNPATDESTQQTTDDQNASQTDEPTLKDPVVEVVADNTEEVAPADDTGEQQIGGEEGGGAKLDVVNLGKFVWDVVKDNSPVADQKSDNANAVPKGASFTDLSGWESDPHSMKLRYHTENIIGTNATDINITCEWYYNGKYNGSGQFINAATVYASVDAAFGSTINIKASIDNPMNMGTTQALAVLPVRITMQESNKFQNFTTVYSGQIKGNGGGYLKQE
jgi:hypothetical protein